MIEGGDPLAVALSDVAALGTDRDRDRIAAIRDRLRSARLRVLVAGEAKRGKSTLVNALLGQPVLPVGVTPLTAVATTVRYGDNPHAEVRFADGHEERHPYAALDNLVTERGNPDEVTLTRRAAQMRAGDAAQRVEEFGARLAAVAIHSRDAVAVVSAESGRLLLALNDAADKAVRRLRDDVGRRLDELAGGELRAAAPADIERKGYELLAALVLDSVSTWRDERREQIEQGLARVDARLAGDLKAELDVLRGSAAELLDLDLAVPEPGGRLAEDRHFFFSTGQDAGQTELLAGTIRRSLPGGVGRRRAGAYLRRTAADLVGSQVGRARADLQYRLAEATRALARVVEQRYVDGAERMSAALRTAADLHQASGAEAGRKETELAEREGALRRVLGLLDQVVA